MQDGGDADVVAKASKTNVSTKKGRKKAKVAQPTTITGRVNARYLQKQAGHELVANGLTADEVENLRVAEKLLGRKSREKIAHFKESALRRKEQAVTFGVISPARGVHQLKSVELFYSAPERSTFTDSNKKSACPGLVSARSTDRRRTAGGLFERARQIPSALSADDYREHFCGERTLCLEYDNSTDDDDVGSCSGGCEHEISDSEGEGPSFVELLSSPRTKNATKDMVYISDSEPEENEILTISASDPSERCTPTSSYLDGKELASAEVVSILDSVHEGEVLCIPSDDEEVTGLSIADGAMFKNVVTVSSSPTAVARSTPLFDNATTLSSASSSENVPYSFGDSEIHNPSALEVPPSPGFEEEVPLVAAAATPEPDTNILSDRPITPNFHQMSVSELRDLTDRFGLERARSRELMINMLLRCWETNADVATTIACQTPRQARLTLHAHISNELRTNNKATLWWTRILAYEPLHYDSFKMFLKNDLGFDFSKELIRDWCDVHGVTTTEVLSGGADHDNEMHFPDD